MEEYIFTAQKVRLDPNKAQVEVLENLFGQSRFIFNFGVKYFNSVSKTEKAKLNGDLIRNIYLKRKKEFEFLNGIDINLENKVFQNLNKAIQVAKARKKKEDPLLLKFKKKYLSNAFYLKGSSISIKVKESSVKNFIYFNGLASPIKILDKLRFHGKIISCTFKKVDNKYYVAIIFKLPKSYFENKHTFEFLRNGKMIGIDVGLKNTLTTSCGLVIDAPLFLIKNLRHLKHLNKDLQRKSLVLQEDGTYKKSKNYLRMQQKLAKFYLKAFNKRENYNNKVASVLVRNFDGICMENLEIEDLMHRKFFSRKNNDIAFGNLKLLIKNKCDSITGRIFVEAEKYYPSSKRCVKCGAIKQNLDLSDRIYRCDNCGAVIDRDFNAACNLFKYMKKKIGSGTSKLTIAEKDKLINDCIKNGINYSFVEPINVSNSFKNIANQANSLKRIETIPHI